MEEEKTKRLQKNPGIIASFNLMKTIAAIAENADRPLDTITLRSTAPKKVQKRVQKEHLPKRARRL